MLFASRDGTELHLNSPGRVVTVTGTEIALTRTEFDLLEFMTLRPGVAVPTNLILEGVWGWVWPGGRPTLHTHMHHLRGKLGPSAGAMLVTLRSYGYRFDGFPRG